MRILRIFSLTLGLLANPMVSAETLSSATGTDRFYSGSALVEEIDAPRDAFVAGRSVTAKGNAGGDLHVAGFDVDIETKTLADLYAMGATVTVRAEIGEDLTVMGMTVRTAHSAATRGNARLMGETVTIDGPVSGALSATGREIVLNSEIAGDTRLTAKTITFGPKAKILGKLAYSTEKEIAVPERVAPADRVTFTQYRQSNLLRDIRRNWDATKIPVLPTFMSMLGGFLITLAFFLILGAIALTFVPKHVEKMRKNIGTQPGQMILVGVVGLSLLFGMIPITALTIVGLPIVPIALLAIILAWTLGYVLAAYSVALRVWQAFGGELDPSKVGKLLALAVAVICVSILNFIPFVGWVANYSLVLLGVGAMTHALFMWMITSPAAARDVDMNLKTEES